MQPLKNTQVLSIEDSGSSMERKQLSPKINWFAKKTKIKQNTGNYRINYIF